MLKLTVGSLLIIMQGATGTAWSSPLAGSSDDVGLAHQREVNESVGNLERLVTVMTWNLLAAQYTKHNKVGELL